MSGRAKATLYVCGVLLPPVLTPGVIRTASSAERWLLLLFLAITIVGVWLVYRANTSGDGQNLIERIVCLSAPLWLLALLTYMVIGAA